MIIAISDSVKFAAAVWAEVTSAEVDVMNRRHIRPTFTIRTISHIVKRVFEIGKTRI